jgi:multiple sugar transport system ATP-binding protein
LQPSLQIPLLKGETTMFNLFKKKATTAKADDKKALEAEKEEKLQEKKRELVHKEMIKQEEENRKKPKVAPQGFEISLQHINKIYPNHVQAVFDFNLDIKEKEFIVLVGPSGCGKSTTLRMIAGLEDITAGDLYISGQYANDLEPKDRKVAMVFQSYALYPHMTIYENMAFGLEMQHLPKPEIDKRVMHAAEILEISEFLDRKPNALSGGQRQRVALGRAIVKDARVFLMDEPLSNLDAKLRVQMRSEIVKLHRSLGATTIYVTHDQTEAMTMATRIVVMQKGVVQQIGSPKEIYNCPANVFVSTFIGAPGMNIFNVHYRNGEVTFENGYVLKLSDENIANLNKYYDKKLVDLKAIQMLLAKRIEKMKEDPTQADHVEILENDEKKNEVLIKHYQDIKDTNAADLNFGIRPEDIAEDSNSQLIEHKSLPFDAKISISELLGNEYHVHSEIGKTQFVAKFSANKEVFSDEDIKMIFNIDKIHLFDELSTERIF